MSFRKSFWECEWSRSPVIPWLGRLHATQSSVSVKTSSGVKCQARCFRVNHSGKPTLKNSFFLILILPKVIRKVKSFLKKYLDSWYNLDMSNNKPEKASKKKVVKDKKVIKKPTITFDVWFSLKVARKELKSWHRLEISTFFFHDFNLSQEEEIETYDKIFELY